MSAHEGCSAARVYTSDVVYMSMNVSLDEGLIRQVSQIRYPARGALPQTTDLGVRGSTPLGRANLFKNFQTCFARPSVRRLLVGRYRGELSPSRGEFGARARVSDGRRPRLRPVSELRNGVGHRIRAAYTQSHMRDGNIRRQ